MGLQDVTVTPSKLPAAHHSSGWVEFLSGSIAAAHGSMLGGKSFVKGGIEFWNIPRTSRVSRCARDRVFGVVEPARPFLLRPKRLFAPIFVRKARGCIADTSAFSRVDLTSSN